MRCDNYNQTADTLSGYSGRRFRKRNEEKDIRVLSVDEQKTFFDCCKGTFYDNFFTVAVSTGMRIGELAALRWEDIDLENKIIHVTRTLIYQKFEGDEKKEFHFGDPKTWSSTRDIPINNQCEIALKKQALFFCTYNNSFLYFLYVQ